MAPFPPPVAGPSLAAASIGGRLHIHGIKEMPAGHDAEVAELFRDLRAASGLSEADLAGQLATRIEVVQALENGALYALPPWVETNRIVTRYGALLNLDVRPLLRRIHAQVEAGTGALAPRPMPEAPFMQPPRNGAQTPGSQWPSPAAPFNQGVTTQAPPPAQRPSPFPTPFNEPSPSQLPRDKFSPSSLPFSEPALGRPASGFPSSSPFQSSRTGSSGFGSGVTPAAPASGTLRQYPGLSQRPAFSPDLKPSSKPLADTFAKAETTRAQLKENLADANTKKTPRRGLLKWGVVLLVASGAAFGIWIWLSQANLAGPSEPQPAEQGASKDEAAPPAPAEGPDPRSRKADRLPGPS